MSEGFNKGWADAVKWIYENSIKGKLSEGINPSGSAVSSKMQQMPKEYGYDAGFTEGLIYAIGKPINELKIKVLT